MDQSLPKPIRDQLEAAERIEQELYGQPAAPVEAQPAPDTENTPAPDQPVEAAPAEPAATEVHQPAAIPQEEETFKRRFEVLQGKYSAEVPRLHQQLREQNDRFDKLMEELNKLKDRPTEEAAAKASQKDVEDFGADLIDMVQRHATRIVQNHISQLEAVFRNEVRAVQAQVGNVTEQVAMSKDQLFWTAVMKAVPDWESVDSDPSWAAWLDSRAEGSKRTRRELAGEAIAGFDHEPIVELVSLWKKTTAPAAQPAPQSASDLQRQVVPASTRSAAPASPTAKIYTAADVARLGDPRYVASRTEAQLEQEQAEIDRAVAEGRVRW